jgi:hypothetical protein
MRKNWNRRFDMNKTFALLAVLAAGMPAAAADHTVQGVDWDAVPWATFCPSVEAVELRTEAGHCTTTHPASQAHARWTGFGMGVKEPKPDCAHLEQEYRKATSPKLNHGKASNNPGVTWGFCKSAFYEALQLRASQPERFAEPLDQWRKRYFGAYLIHGTR